MTLLSQLSNLESAGLIGVAQIEPDLQYLFRHALVQDAAYDSLLTSDQRRLHHAVGRAVERLYPDRLDEYAPLLAHHFAHAGEPSLALIYFRRAGDAALAAYANKEAEGHYRRALEHGRQPDSGQQAGLLASLGEALYRQSRHEEALDTWQRAIHLYTQSGDLDAVARLYARSARAVWHYGDHARGLALCQQGLAAVEAAPESAHIALLLHEAGRAHYFNRHLDATRDFCARALAMAERHGAVDVQADTLATYGVLPDIPVEEAVRMLTRAVDLAESAGLLEIATRANHNLAATLRSTVGDFDAAYRHFMRAAGLARKRGAAHEEIFGIAAALGLLLDNGPASAIEDLLPRIEHLYRTSPYNPILDDARARLLERQGEWQPALALRRESYQEAQRRGDFQAMYDMGSGLSWLLLEMHRLDEFPTERASDAALDEVEDILANTVNLDSGKLGTGIYSLCQLAMLRAHQGRLDEARSLLADAPSHAGHKGLTWHKMTLLEIEGRIATVARDWDQVISAFEAAAAQSTRLGLRWQRAYHSLHLAEGLVARGTPADVERAQALLRDARDVFRDLGAPYYVALAAERLQHTRTRSHAHVAALTQAARELAVAGKIQSGLLPREIPRMPGWQMTATLEAARETSGDFYDFITLESRMLALVIADVADKGAGAALYMALARTLLRTYASTHPDSPAAVLDAVNRRILSETDTDMFVTLFYGVLDPDRGTLSYANAGHNPPFVLRSTGLPARPLEADGVEFLSNTGMALGIVPEAVWREETVHLRPSDTLVLYTDGAVDARSSDDRSFGRERLLAASLDSAGAAALEVERAILDALHRFVADAPRFDDITLIVVRRT